MCVADVLWMCFGFSCVVGVVLWVILRVLVLQELFILHLFVCFCSELIRA